MIHSVQIEDGLSGRSFWLYKAIRPKVLTGGNLLLLNRLGDLKDARGLIDSTHLEAWTRLSTVAELTIRETVLDTITGASSPDPLPACLWIGRWRKGESCSSS